MRGRAIELIGMEEGLMQLLTGTQAGIRDGDVLARLLARQPDLRGIYVAGGGLEGAIAALREARPLGDVALIVSALTPESRGGLAEGLITLTVDTPLEKLCRDLMTIMTRAATEGRGPGGLQHFLPPDLHIAESV